MNKRIVIASVCAVVISLGAVARMSAQGGGNAPSYPQLPFHLVEDFFQFPA